VLEKRLQTLIKKYLKSEGIVAYKVDSTSGRGMPDLLCVGYGVVFFMEVKTAKGVVSRLQEIRHEELMAHGAHVYVARNLDDVKEIVRELYEANEDYRLNTRTE